MTDWFRSWHGAPTDPKWRAIAKRAGNGVRPGDVAAIVWALLDYASANDSERGSIVDFDAEGLAAQFDYDEAQIEAVITALREKGIIKDERFAKWEKRQPKREDSSAERMRHYRERHANERSVTQRDAHVTQRDAHVTQRDAHVTQRDAPDTEERREEESSPPPIVPPRTRAGTLSVEMEREFASWWSVWPVKQGKEPAKRAFAEARKTASLDDLIAGARRYAVVLCGPDPPKPKFPQGWLNDKRWLDEPLPMRPDDALRPGDPRPIQFEGPKGPPPKILRFADG